MARIPSLGRPCVEHIQRVSVFHLVIIGTVSWTQALAIEGEAKRLHVDPLPSAVGVHQLSEGGGLLYLEMNDGSSILVLNSNLDVVNSGFNIIFAFFHG